MGGLHFVSGGEYMQQYTLANLRKNKKLTQRELARKLGFPASNISMYESGARLPSLTRAKKIASFFEVPIEAIIFGSLAHEKEAKKF